MSDFLLYLLAGLCLPVSALIVTYFVSRDTDRMIAKARQDRAERNARHAR